MHVHANTASKKNFIATTLKVVPQEGFEVGKVLLVGEFWSGAVEVTVEEGEFEAADLGVVDPFLAVQLLKGGEGFCPVGELVQFEVEGVEGVGREGIVGAGILSGVVEGEELQESHSHVGEPGHHREQVEVFADSPAGVGTEGGKVDHHAMSGLAAEPLPAQMSGGGGRGERGERARHDA